MAVEEYVEERTDVFGGKYKVINYPKRKAWNMLIREGGIVQPNKLYIKHNGIIWHNNRSLPYLFSN